MIRIFELVRGAPPKEPHELERRVLSLGVAPEGVQVGCSHCGREPDLHSWGKVVMVDTVKFAAFNNPGVGEFRTAPEMCGGIFETTELTLGSAGASDLEEVIVSPGTSSVVVARNAFLISSEILGGLPHNMAVNVLDHAKGDPPGGGRCRAGPYGNVVEHGDDVLLGRVKQREGDLAEGVDVKLLVQC